MKKCYSCRIYTGGDDAEFIFALGPQYAMYLAKFDAKTLELLQKVDFGEEISCETCKRCPIDLCIL